MPLALLKKVFSERFSPRHLRRHRSLPTLLHHFRKAARTLIAKPRKFKLPPGPLVTIADGIWLKFKNDRWILYQVALKPCSSNIAHVLDPVIIRGRETAAKWWSVLNAIPEAYQSRIVALVVDNVSGMKRMARQRSWVLQHCRVHLLRRLQVHRAMTKKALKGGAVRWEVYRLIRRILDLPGGEELESAVAALRAVIRDPAMPPRIQALSREFLASLSCYRAHKTHPLMGIPSSTNSIESLNGTFRDMFRRSRSGTTPRSIKLWTTAFVRLRPTITCNGDLSTEFL